MNARAGMTMVTAVLVGLGVGGCSSGGADDASRAAHDAQTKGAAAVRSAKAKASASMSQRAASRANGTRLIDHVRWVTTSGGGSLHVIPTAAGRHEASVTGDAAWIQVERLARAAGGEAARVVDKPGMKAQFVCHWQFARVKEPNKPSWNLEPWRPVVSEKALLAARCNPGGAEGPDQ